MNKLYTFLNVDTISYCHLLERDLVPKARLYNIKWSPPYAVRTPLISMVTVHFQQQMDIHDKFETPESYPTTKQAREEAAKLA